MTYTHPDNCNIPYKDWRLPDNRYECFLLWLDWRMKYGDLDHYVCNNSYRDTHKSPTGKPMTRAQSIWFSIIFGMTYQSEMAWVIYWNFPNLFDIDLEELKKWNIENMHRQHYARDTKYNKGRIVEQVESVLTIVGDAGGLEQWADSFVAEDEAQSFQNAYNGIMKFYKFGRMTTWICAQTLFETAGIKIRPDTLLASDPSNWSVRSGLYFLYNKDEKMEATGAKFDKNDIPWILWAEKDLYARCCAYLSKENQEIFSNYLVESHLCQFKKLMLGGDYAGHSSGDHVTRAQKLQSAWKGVVDFSAFFEDAIMKHHPLVRGLNERKDFRNICSETGQMINLHSDYGFMPDMYKELGIPKIGEPIGLERLFSV